MKKKIIQQSIAIIIYARLNSKRLPQKVLLKINSKPLLALIIDRIEKKSKYTIPIIVATSKAESDNKLEKFCKKNKIKIFRGNLNHVFKRTVECLNFYKFKSFIRVCADRPFFDVELMDRMITKFINSDFDIVTNQFPRTYPKGLACEIAKTNIFYQTNYKNINIREKQHIFDYFYRNYKKCNIFNFKLNSKHDLSKKNFSINNKKDLTKTRNIYRIHKRKKYIDILKIK